MQMAQFVESLQADLRELAELGGDELVQATRRLEGAVRQSARLRLLEAFSQIALEVNDQLTHGHVDVRVAGEDPELVYVEDSPAEDFAAPADDDQARITLRLPESLKSAIELAAASEGVSVNTWLVRALQRAVSSGGGARASRSGQRISGFFEA